MTLTTAEASTFVLTPDHKRAAASYRDVPRRTGPDLQGREPVHRQLLISPAPPSASRPCQASSPATRARRAATLRALAVPRHVLRALPSALDGLLTRLNSLARPSGPASAPNTG